MSITDGQQSVRSGSVAAFDSRLDDIFLYSDTPSPEHAVDIPWIFIDKMRLRSRCHPVHLVKSEPI
jgi:hypothetical protein